MPKRHLAKVSRHGSSAMIAVPRPFLFHLDCLYGDYVLLTMNDDGTVTLAKGEITSNTTGARAMPISERVEMPKP